MTDFNTYFTNAANTKSLTRSDIFAKCLIKAIRAKCEDKETVAKALLQRAFTAPTSRNKVANGALGWWGFHHAWYELRKMNVAPFLTDDEYKLFIELANKARYFL